MAVIMETMLIALPWRRPRGSCRLPEYLFGDALVLWRYDSNGKDGVLVVVAM